MRLVVETGAVRLRRSKRWVFGFMVLVGAMALLNRNATAGLVVDLGTCADFAVLAGSTITSTGSTTLNGNLGLWPGTSVTETPAMTVNGTWYGNDVGGVAKTAQSDLTAAYKDAAGRAVDLQVGPELGGTTRTNGVYDSAAGTFAITGTLTLDGSSDTNSVFIFKMASTLVTAGSSKVALINGAQANNVFWQVGSSATLGGSSVLMGSILALTSIDLGTSASVDGRCLARNGAVTLLGNTITIPEPVSLFLFSGGIAMLMALRRQRVFQR